MQTLDVLRKQKVVAIVRLPDLSQAEPLAAALIAGGIGALEFTLTNPDAVKAIAALRKLVKDETAVIGAGSVLTVDQAQACMDAGSEFIVMPVTKPDVIAACVVRGIPVMPGAYTPTEIQTAWELGASVVKVFPARGLGVRYLKDILEPLPHLQLMPTGGIDLTNIREFVSVGVFGVGVGSSLMNKTIIADRDWDALTDLARQFSSAAREAAS